MGQAFGLIAFVSIFTAAVLAWVLNSRKQGRLLKRLTELSLQKGWQIEQKPSTYIDCIIRGQGVNFNWELKYINKERTPNNIRNAGVESIVWFSSGVTSANGLIMLYPNSAKLGGMQNLSGPAEGLIGTVMGMLGIDISGSSLQKAGSAAFQSKYLFFAPDVSNTHLLISAVEPILLRGAASNSFEMPSIMVDSKGITIRVVRTGTSVDFQCQMAEHLTLIGVSAVNALRQMVN